MQKIAFLTMDSLEDFFSYDDMLVEPFAEKGWQVDNVSWRNSQVNWGEYSAVIIRSPWDYQQDPQAFMDCLQAIENSEARLENSLELVKWNIDKAYLQEMERKGAAIVPTVWGENFDFAQLESAFTTFECDEIIIKPNVSANADDTFRLSQEGLAQHKDTLTALFSNRSHMIQPFINNVNDEGEYSLFYFNNQYSHCIVKKPKEGDFRVQEEHGGQFFAVTPEQSLLDAADTAIATLPHSSLYARLDFIRYQGEFLIMEVELIEPSLYFGVDAESPARFVNAFLNRIGSC